MCVGGGGGGRGQGMLECVCVEFHRILSFGGRRTPKFGVDMDGVYSA